MWRHGNWWMRLLAIPAAGLLLVAGCTGSGSGSGGTATTGRAPALPTAPQAPKRQPAARTLVGISHDAPDAGGLPALQRLDPRTLRPLPGRSLRLDGNPAVVTVAPDGSAAVLGDQDSGQLTLVDLTRLRPVGTVTVDASGWAPGASWSGSSQVLLAWSSTNLSDSKASVDLLVLGMSNGRFRVLRERHVDGDVLATGRLGDRLVLLVAPANALGPARLLLAGQDAGVREVALPKIIAGRQMLDSADPNAAPSLRQAVPGLAVDPTGNRAYVVAADAPVAEVDLGSLAVRYHPLNRPTAPLQRLARWLLPAAEAKEVSGPVRSALWLGDGLLAVTGSDATVLGTSGFKQEPAGLQLIDLRTWTSYALDPHADTAVLAGDRLLTTGVTVEPDKDQGYGLTIFGPGNRQPTHLLGTQQVGWLLVNGNLAYVAFTAPDGATSHAVIDLHTPRVLRQDSGDLPQLLLPDQP